MHVGLIGYRNHSARVLEFVLESSLVDRVSIYHNDMGRLMKSGIKEKSPITTYTSCFPDLFHADAVFITSPPATHVTFVEALIDKVGHIYCEKPPACTEEELEYLNSLNLQEKERLYINYNYRHSELFYLAQRFIENRELGDLIHLDFTSTHGLALSDSTKNDWRFQPNKPLEGIFGNVAIHYIDMCMMLLGKIKDIHTYGSNLSGKPGSIDTASITMLFERNVIANILVSYAAPFCNKAQLIFTDAILELDNGTLKLLTPRETYDINGRFSPPPSTVLMKNETSRNYYDISLRNSINYFLHVANNLSLIHI